jgi:hypothetical protein
MRCDLRKILRAELYAYNQDAVCGERAERKPTTVEGGLYLII